MTKFYNLTKLLAAMIFKKPSPIIEDGAIPAESQPGMVLRELRELVGEGKINEAENLLFDSLDIKMPVFLAIALDFYARISLLSEKEIADADFSVEEIGEGITDTINLYKIKLVSKPPKANHANNDKVQETPTDQNLSLNKDGNI